ncbi:hypothetical protein LSCM1_06765 [Leishmania martiniquensis]|uniref:Uncharacterized protein n=1 Tax=Leishmania martiniquensis TaxID=1580590 RepID=A0A836KPV5_9TRYP|nr:hypothetical protein LSCM1_06765 [Leishmania martiniquensis]
MRCLADHRESRAGAGAAPPTLGLSAPLSFERSSSAASHASIALLQQSFFDPQPRRAPHPYQRAHSAASVLPSTASTVQRTTSSISPPATHGPLRPFSRPGKEFFEEEGEGGGEAEPTRSALALQGGRGKDAAAAPLPTGAKRHNQARDPGPVPLAVASSHPGAETGEFDEVGAVTCRTTASLPSILSPVPRLPPAPFAATGEERQGQKLGVGSERHPRVAPLFEAPSCAVRRAGTAALAFSKRYAASANAYLRAAALELAEEGLPEARGAAGEILEGALKSAFAPLGNPQDAPPVPAAATHVPPKLMRPASTATQQPPSPTFSPAGDPLLPAALTSSVSFANVSTSTAPMRGIPLFTTMHRPADVASVSPLSSVSSLRLSLAEYGRLHLQDEAVRWYHRCSALEQQLLKLQGAFNRQSRLLTAQWWGNGGNVAWTKVAADAACPSSVEGAAVAVTAGSPSRRAADLTSLSPDTHLRAHAYDENEGRSCAGQTEKERQRVGSDDSQPSLSESRKRIRVDDRAPSHEPTLGKLTEDDMQYRIPKASCDGAEDEDASPYLPKHDSGSQVRRALTGAGDTTASSIPPLLRVSVGLQTDASASGNASLARETRGSSVTGLLSAFEEAAGEGPSRLSSVAASSAILSRRYAAAMEEMKLLRARLDEAERKCAELQETCAAKDLRCDDLETQLLGKEELLLRFQQPGPEPAAPLSSDGPNVPLEAAASALLPVELSPLITQLRGLLTLLRPGSDSAHSERSVLATGETGTAEARAAEGTFSSAFNGFSAEGNSAAAYSTSSSPKSPHAGTSTYPDRNVALLASLIAQVRSALINFSQRFAALEAELDVVRADRNELIGEQSEQVRMLQEQLLEKDTAQWKLLEELHQAKEQLSVSAAQTSLVPADDAASSRESATLHHPQTRGGNAEGGTPAVASDSTAQRSSCPVSEAVTDTMQGPSPQRVRTAACPTLTADTTASEVEALRERLTQARVSAAAGQEVQRQVLSERLERAELQLKETRLRAEDEYDRMSAIIEELTRELTDTREALRVKEVSLRIALRESFLPPLQITREGDRAASDGAAATEGLARAAASSTVVSPMPLQRAMPRVSAASSLSPRPGRQSARTSTSPSPPVPLYLQSEAGTEKARAAADTGESDGGHGLALEAKAMVGPRIDDDGTLRTLPSALLVNDEGLDRIGLSSPPSALTFTTATATTTAKTSSREKSSRGLTVSAGGGSQDATSLTRGRSDGSVPMMGPAGTAEEAMRWEESLPPSRAHAPRDTQEEEAETVAVEEQRSICSSPPRSPQRKSATARLTGSASEEGLPLPPPLRSPLFLTVSPSPEDQQRQHTHVPHREETTHRASLGSQTFVAQGKEPHVPPQLSEPPAQSLSPEEKLRQFLSMLSAVTSPFEEKVKESGRPLPGNRATFTRRPTPQSDIDPKTVSHHAQPEDIADAALPTTGSRALSTVNRDETTPGRTPLSLYAASASPSPVPSSTASRRASTLVPRSPHSTEVAARHVQESLSRHREAWQQQEIILHSLLSSPSL